MNAIPEFMRTLREESERFRNPVFDLSGLALPSIFWNPGYTSGSIWLEHVPFCFWLVEALRPRTIVDARTKDGVGFFACCEAVARLGLDTVAYGNLDSEPERAERILSYQDVHYRDFARLSTEAASAQEPSSVDLLLISDGPGFDAAADYRAWAGRLSDRAVVVVQGGSGEVLAAADSGGQIEAGGRFMFVHGRGLEAYAHGSTVPELFRYLSSLEDSRKIALVRAMFARLGRAVAETYRHQKAKEAMESAARQLDAAQKRASQLSADLRTTQGNLSDLQQERERSQREQERLRKLLEHAQHELRRAERDSERSRQEVKRIREALEHSAQEIDRAREELECYRQKLQETAARLEEQRSRSARIVRESDKAAVEYEKRIEALTARTCLLEADKLAAVREALEAKKRVAGLKGEAAVFRNRFRDEQRRRQETEAQMTMLLGSRSWKVTAPLRWLLSRIR